MIIALDTETACFTDDNPTPPIACVQLATADNVNILHWSEAQRWVEGIIRDPSIHIVGCEIAYDMACIVNQWPHLWRSVFDAYEANRIQDVSVNTSLLDIATGKHFGYSVGLDNLARRFTDHKLNKDNPWRLRFGELINVALSEWPSEALTYAREDARATFDVWTEIERTTDPRFLVNRYAKARTSFWLKLMSNRGLLTNPSAVDAFEHELKTLGVEQAALLLKYKLARWGGTKKQPKLVKTVANARKWTEAICRLNGVDVQLTDTGLTSLEGEYLMRLGDPVLKAYAGYSATLKKLSNDIPLLRRGDTHRIRSHFEVLKDTGRTGSSDPNVQNFDRDSVVRECFVPPEGYVYACADYGKGELCTWTQICLWLFGDSDMARVLNAGGDPHGELGALIGDRGAAKPANFGFNAGMGIQRMKDSARTGYGVDKPLEFWKQVKNHWRNRWREGKWYLDWATATLEGRDEIEYTHWVSQRVRLIRPKAGKSLYSTFCNTGFQALLADAATHAGFYIARACYAEPDSALYGSFPVNFPHDEFIVESPRDRAPWAAEELSRIMHEKAADYIPDVTPKADPLLSECWSKSAKTVRDEKGVLVPWTPKKAA